LTNPKAPTHETTFDIGEKKMPHLLIFPLPFVNLEDKAIDALLGDEAAAVFPYHFGPCD
jgi:hypothetical protein